MLRDHDYDALVAETLGHAAAATGLIAQSLKFDGAITLQIQSAGRLQMLVMQSTNDFDMRGMAHVDETRSAGDFAELTAKSRCAVTVDSGERPYQGIVEMDATSLAASLEHYFARSVQVPSHVVLVANEELAGGILLQQVPGQLIEEDDWNRLHFLAETLTQRDCRHRSAQEAVCRGRCARPRGEGRQLPLPLLGSQDRGCPQDAGRARVPRGSRGAGQH
jgi:molecular chaperone Hsp33